MAGIIVLKRNREIIRINDEGLTIFNIKNPNLLVRRKLRFLRFDLLADMLEDFVESTDEIWKKQIPHPQDVQNKAASPRMIQCELIKLFKSTKQIEFIVLVLEDK